MRLKKLCLIVVLIAIFGFVSMSFSALATIDSGGATTCNEGTDLLSIESTPTAILLSSADSPRFINPTGDPQSEVVSIEVEVNDAGELLGGVAGDDLLVVGEVDLDGDGGVDHPGVLLTGEVLDFGFTPSECGECEGKVTQLTLQYNGAEAAFIEVVQKKSCDAVFSGMVQQGEQFTFSGTDKKGTLGSKIRIYVDDMLNTKIHTGCSHPIGSGLVSGDFEVIEGYSRKGGLLCPIEPPLLGVVPARETESWMENIYTNSDAYLKDIFIPGTHNSGTYGITSSSDQADDFDSWFYELSGAIMAAWSRCQEDGILEQLEAGIRYLDLRIEYHSGLMVVHGMISDSLNNVLDDIRTFSIAHPKEIVIVDFQALNFSSEHNDYFDQLLQSKLGGYMISRSTCSPNSTIHELWNANQGSVIVVLSNYAIANMRNEYWLRSSTLDSEYVETKSESELKSEVRNGLINRVSDQFSVAQVIFTMDYWAVVSDPLGGKKGLNEPLEDAVGAWMVDWYVDSVPMNIVMVDFYNRGRVVETALVLNDGTYYGFMPGSAEKDDHLGYAQATGDFNGDGFDDIAMGAPYEDVDGQDDAGAVNVLYGSLNGLSHSSGLSRIWHQNIPGIKGDCEDGDNFGYSLASGDFNGDGYDDLAIGVPKEDVGSGGNNNDGLVNVIYGSINGLTSSDQMWHQDVSGIEGGSETDDHFGFSLAAGDFDNDGYDDLAVGVPKEDVDGDDDAGAVNIIFGSYGGLTASGDIMFTQDSSGIAGSTEGDDHFGYSLTTGDFNNDGYDDLAIGVPKEDLSSGGNNNDGNVHILFGRSSGLSGSGSQDWHQNISGIKGGSEKDDHFGFSLAAGDFDNDGYDDLAVGVPKEDVDGDDDAGAVNIIFGSYGGLTASGDIMFSQDSTGITGVTEGDDHFGYSLTTGDFNNDGYDDLAIGVPKEDLSSGGNNNDGLVHILFGRSSGLSGSGSQEWNQDVYGVEGTSEVDDHFGFSLAAGDFNGDGIFDLGIGVPKEDLSFGGNNNDGLVHILMGKSGIGLTVDGAQIWFQ